MKDRRVLTKSFASEYRKASRASKGEILDRFSEMAGCNRTYAARLLRNHGRRESWTESGVVFQGDASRKVGRRPRARRYGEDVRRALIRVWEMLDFMCGKRLAAVLPDVVDRLERFGELRLAAPTRDLLCRVSAATIDRMLAEERGKHRLRGRSLTKPGTLLKREIPLKIASDWRRDEPGWVEADLVGHEGGRPSGDFACTLVVTDAASGWTVMRAVRNKAQVWVLQAMESIASELPFPLRAICCDNGSEFINKHLKRFCDTRGVLFCRTRPGRKNDNCRVEERNWSMARQAAGYARFQGEAAVRLLNQLYRPWCLRANFFKPSLLLKSKVRVGSSVRRQWMDPRTPCLRLLDSAQLDEGFKRGLRAMWEDLNPAQLHRRIGSLLPALEAVAAKNERGLLNAKLCDSGGRAAERG